MKLILNDINYLSSKIGLDNWFDSRLWYSYKSAVSYNAIPHIAHNISKIIFPAKSGYSILYPPLAEVFIYSYLIPGVILNF